MLKSCKVTLIMMLMLFMMSCESKPERPVYLNMVFNFTDAAHKGVNFKPLNSPFTRFNITQNIFGLAHRLKKYPQIHLTVNINSALLNQLEKNYLERLKPNIHLANEKFDVDKFKIQYMGKSDPWIDLLVTNSEEMTRKQRDYLYNWSGEQDIHCFSIDESVIGKFPDFEGLIPDNIMVGKFKGTKKRKEYTTEDRTKLKFLFNLAGFDPLLLQGAVKLPIRNEMHESAYSKLHKWVRWEKNDPENPKDDQYFLSGKITEKDCQQLVIEIYKILASVIPAYKKNIYQVKREKGQFDLMFSPYENPVLALVQDSKNGNTDDLPSRYFYPEDASWQLRLGMAGFKERFKNVPKGLWMDEGTVLGSMLPLFVNEGVQWTIISASQEFSSNKNKMCSSYNFSDEKKNHVVAFLPEKNFSGKFENLISGGSGISKIRNYLDDILQYAPGKVKEPVVTVVCNQENFLHETKFSLQNPGFMEDFLFLTDSLYTSNELITLTPSEYLNGNIKRKIAKHPAKILTKLARENTTADFNNWIGTAEQNLSWEYLLMVREVFEKMNLQYNPEHPNSWIKKAWEEFFAAQNSKWFQGNLGYPINYCQNMDNDFRERLYRVYYYLNKAGFELDVPAIPAIVQTEQKLNQKNPFESDPTINGRQDKIWASQGAYSADRDGDSDIDFIEKVYWGHDTENAYFSLKSKNNSLERAFKYDSLIMVVYSFPQNVKRITADEKISNWNILKTSTKLKNNLNVFKFHKDSITIASPDTTIQVAVKNKFLELSIPLKNLKNKSETKKFFIQLWRDDKIEDYFPNSGFLEVNIGI